MKKFLAFEVLLELAIDKSSEELSASIKRNKYKSERNREKGYPFFHVKPVPTFFELLVKHSEEISLDRILVDYLDENMVEQNYNITNIEIERSKKDLEDQIRFYSRLKYCGD